MNYDLDYIGKITGLTSGDRDKLILYYRKLSEDERIECEKLRYDLFMQNRSSLFTDTTKKNEYNYACLLLAIFKMQKLDPDIARKRNLMTLSEEERRIQFQRKAARIRERQTQKTSPKKAFILKNYDEIIEMRDQAELSIPAIIDYFAKSNPKLGRITESYFRRILRQEEERRKRQETVLYM